MEKQLIKKIETALIGNTLTTALIDGVIHMDFECDMDNSHYLLNKAEEAIEGENIKSCNFNVAEVFSDGSAFCTIKIVI